VVLALFEDFARHENARAFEVFDEEVVFDMRRLPGPAEIQAVYHGHEGVRRYWRQWLDAWDEVPTIDGPHCEAHGNQVLIWWRQRNRGKRSGIEVEMDVAAVWTFLGDRIVHAAAFPSQADAREAVGLGD
jgi:ketosteroid isomerase-like protein